MVLESYQVLQRSPQGEARVEANGETLTLKTGGPYQVGSATDILVGDLWVLAGQSNMEGCGDLVDLETPDPLVHSFQSREEWAIAKEPLHWLGGSPRVVHHNLGGQNSVPNPLPLDDPNRTKGSGLGLTFAKTLSHRTGVPIGLIPAAHGGTSMQQWSPKLKDRGSASLYGATIERIKANGGKVAGILWYQGESDCNPDDVKHYDTRMTELVNAFRSDLGQPDLPFYLVQLGVFINEGVLGGKESWTAVREIQRTWAAKTSNSGIVSAIDLGLDDGIHVSTSGLKKLGQRFADVAIGQPSPDLLSAAIEGGFAKLRVTYKNVRGALKAAGIPTGYSIRTAQGVEIPMIYKIVLDGDSAVLHLDGGERASGNYLYYGWGTHTYANITDAGDAAVPAFGPIKI